VLGGVCGGFANYTGLDANLIRILLVAAVVLGAGTPAIVYVAAWLLMPEE
jgi:phage shock protein PspC (stress-responsive transcriptional regulator)